MGSNWCVHKVDWALNMRHVVKIYGAVSGSRNVLLTSRAVLKVDY